MTLLEILSQLAAAPDDTTWKKAGKALLEALQARASREVQARNRSRFVIDALERHDVAADVLLELLLDPRRFIAIARESAARARQGAEEYDPAVDAERILETYVSRMLAHTWIDRVRRRAMIDDIDVDTVPAPPPAPDRRELFKQLRRLIFALFDVACDTSKSKANRVQQHETLDRILDLALGATTMADVVAVELGSDPGPGTQPSEQTRKRATDRFQQRASRLRVLLLGTLDRLEATQPEERPAGWDAETLALARRACLSLLFTHHTSGTLGEEAP